jgi:Predicted membrane protein
MVSLLLIVLASLIPAIVYLIIIRNSEFFRRERWSRIAGVFLWGVIALFIAAVIEPLFGFSFMLTAVIVAPIVEEIFKPLIIFRMKLGELEDGIIYGASAGVGFACVENILFFVQSAEASFLPLLIIIRTIDGYMIHSAAGGFTGLGIAKRNVFPFLCIAIVIHSASNFLLPVWACSGWFYP